MGESLKDLERQGFAVKTKPKKKPTNPVQRKVKVVEKIVEKKIDRIVNQPVTENTGVLNEVVKTNQVMHSAIAALTETMKDLGYRPKSLKCENIKRDTRGLMTSFEIKVL